jgi:hypothetical protein
MRWFRYTRERLEVTVTVALSLSFIAFFLGATWILCKYFMEARVENRNFALAIAFLTMQVSFITLELVISCGVKKLDEIRRGKQRRLEPEIHGRLAAHLTGEDWTPWLRRMGKKHPWLFEDALAACLQVAGGTARWRLEALTSELRFPKRWRKRARKGHLRERLRAVEFLAIAPGAADMAALRKLAKKSSPRLEAAALRVLLEEGEQSEEVERLFRSTVEKSYLVRLLVAAEFRPHAEALCSQVIAGMAECGAAELGRALEMAEAWRCALRSPAIAALARNGQVEHRSLALRLMGFQGATEEFALLLVDGLVDDDLRIQESALRATARSAVEPPWEAVEECARSANFALARLACAVMGSGGAEGSRRLERLIVCGEDHTAALAAEALSATRVGRPLEAK